MMVTDSSSSTMVGQDTALLLKVMGNILDTLVIKMLLPPTVAMHLHLTHLSKLNIHMASSTSNLCTSRDMYNNNSSNLREADSESLVEEEGEGEVWV